MLTIIVLAFVNIGYFLYIGITDTAYLSLSFINTIICMKSMFSDEKQAFTLVKMVNLFIYIFFILANGVQLALGSRVLTFSCVMGMREFIFFQAVLLIILICFNGSYYFFYKKEQRKIPTINPTNKPRNIKVKYKILLIVSLVGCVLTLAYYGFNPTQLFLRGAAETAVADSSSTTASNNIFQQVIRPIPFCCFVICMLCNAPKKVILYTFILMAITVFPTGIARNAAAMYWIPVLVLFFQKKMRHNLFMWLMLGAIFVVFPFLNLFRSAKAHNFEFEWSMKFFSDINFDAGQLFMATIKTDLVTYGYQLLGPLFFYVPRSIWPSKPIGSGHLLTTMHNAFFTNVSMPYFSEGYINFGWLGVVIFTLFLAYLCARLDVVYWKKWFPSRNLKCGYYLILLGAIIFIMRGDLMSSTAYTVGIMISYSMIMALCTNYHFTRIRWK